METNGQAVDLLPRLSEYYNTGIAGIQASEYANQAQSVTRNWDALRGVLDDESIKLLQERTRNRQIAMLASLKASGKSLLSTPVKKRDSTSK